MANDLFHSYDIRGDLEDFTNKFLKSLSNGLTNYFKTGSILIAHDARKNSEEISKILSEELVNNGFSVKLLGMSSTPYFYHSMNQTKADAGLMVTASHLAPDKNGIKISGKNGVPIGMESGLNEIKKGMQKKPRGRKKGSIESVDCIDTYQTFFKGKPYSLRIQIDVSNGTGNIEANLLAERFAQANMINQNPDMIKPKHSLNPLDADAKKNVKVKATQYDFSVIFDGDADRAVFVDDTGKVVKTDVIGMLLAPKDLIIRDLTCTKMLDEKHKVITTKVGRSNVAKAMKEYNAEFGFEKSGHIFFKEFYGLENPGIAALKVAELIRTQKKPLSKILEKIPKYYTSQEKIEQVTDLELVYEALKKKFKRHEFDWLDGLTFTVPEGFINIRKSNTEPIMRVTIEATTKRTYHKFKSAIITTKAL